MNVLLINPPSSAPNPIMPLGLAYLAAYLEQRGQSVAVIDAWAEGLDVEGLGRRIREYNPGVIGITIMSPVYASGMKAVDAARRNSSAVIVVGGPHASALPEQCLEDNGAIDFVVRGEGEICFADLVQALEAGASDFSGIKGLVYRKDGGCVDTGPAEPVADLDELPYPARHLFPVESYRTHPPYGRQNPYLNIITSRGCPYKCTYCSKAVFGSTYRAMSPRRVVEEVKHIIRKYGVREIHFYDDDFTLNMKRAADICDLMIAERVRVSWSCTTRVNLVDEPLLRKMKKAGCWLISYGVESADPAILKTIRKGYTLQDVEKAFALTRRAGIRTVAFLMVGLPGESEATIHRTIDFSLKLKPDFVSWGITSLYPGSTMYRQAQAGELGDVEVRYTYTRDDWHASGSPFGDGYSIIFEETLTRDQLKDYVKKANRKFYLRPSYMIKTLLNIRSFHELRHYSKACLNVFKWLLSRETGHSERPAAEGMAFGCRTEGGPKCSC